MPISFKAAKTALDKDRVFKLRHRVFVLEEKRFDHPSDRIYDFYDTLEETANILAMDGDIPVGAIRMTLENPAGLPALEHYDFGPLMNSLEGKFAGIGWLCVPEKYRKYRGLVPGLFKMMAREARKRGAQHLIAPLHPGALSLLKRFGARAVDKEFYSEALSVPMVPIHIDLEKLPPGVREISQDPVYMIFEDSNERRSYRRGEVIVRKGEPGTEAYLIMRGSVRVASSMKADKGSFPRPGDPDSMESDALLLGPGQVFGELSLLDGGPRTATVVCHSMEADMMVWSQEEFLTQLQTDRHKALEICRIIGKRFRMQIEGFIKTKPEETLIARIIIDASRKGQEPVDLKWLASQCGLWLKDMKPLVNSWAKGGLIACNEANSLHVLDIDALKEKIIID